MSNFVAVYDACVLYPAPLRDLLMHLAVSDLFRARWTTRIHEEWIRNLLAKRRKLTRAQLERTRDLMDASVPDCLVTVIAAVRDHRASLAHPPKTANELLDGYLKQGLVTTANLLRPYTAQL